MNTKKKIKTKFWEAEIVNITEWKNTHWKWKLLVQLGGCCFGK